MSHLIFSVAVAFILLTALNLSAGEVSLKAADATKLFGEFTAAKADNDKIILLFHQARSNHHEYDPVVPELIKLGFDTLAIDQRSGGPMWDHDNQTVKALGQPGTYEDALQDLQAALDWAVAKKYKTIIAVGSSYSASLVFILANNNAGKLSAVAAFSPGEYFEEKNKVKEAVGKTACPIYVTAGTAAKEQSQLDEVLKKGPVKLTRGEPEIGVHGASTLREDATPKGYQENLEDFLKFLRRVSK